VILLFSKGENMNTLLQRLFNEHALSDRDKYEINQIFELLPPDKKQNLLNNFDLLTIRLNKIEEDIRVEREILVWDALHNIRNAIERAKREELKEQILI